MTVRWTVRAKPDRVRRSHETDSHHPLQKETTIFDRRLSLDTIADLVFAVAYSAKILPVLSVPLWIWGWTVTIAVLKITVIVIACKKAHRFLIEHSFGNKLTGLLLFLLPISVFAVDVKYGAVLVCIFATGTLIKEMATQK